jgi:hypothetical protein
VRAGKVTPYVLKSFEEVVNISPSPNLSRQGRGINGTEASLTTRYYKFLTA